MSDILTDMRHRAYRRRCTEMAVWFMEEVFDTTPYLWQQQVIAHLCCMPIPDSGVQSAPVLLVRPTGGGKSSVRDVYDLSLTITPLLSLEISKKCTVYPALDLSMSDFDKMRQGKAKSLLLTKADVAASDYMTIEEEEERAKKKKKTDGNSRRIRRKKKKTTYQS